MRTNKRETYFAPQLTSAVLNRSISSWSRIRTPRTGTRLLFASASHTWILILTWRGRSTTTRWSVIVTMKPPARSAMHFGGSSARSWRHSGTRKGTAQGLQNRLRPLPQPPSCGGADGFQLPNDPSRSHTNSAGRCVATTFGLHGPTVCDSRTKTSHSTSSDSDSANARPKPRPQGAGAAGPVIAVPGELAHDYPQPGLRPARGPLILNRCHAVVSVMLVGPAMYPA